MYAIRSYYVLFMAKGLPVANILNAPFVAAEVLNILGRSFGLVTMVSFTALAAALRYRVSRNHDRDVDAADPH